MNTFHTFTNKFKLLFIISSLLIFSTNVTARGGGMGGGGGTVTQGNLRDFAIRNPVSTRNIKGDFQVIGNTVLCVKNSSGNCYNYTGTKSNAELDLKYIDTNSINDTYNNSSEAKIAIPDNATIKWAAIYTQGYLKGESYTDSQTILADPIYVTAPTISRFSVTPSVTDLYANGSNGYTYSTFTELPQLEGKIGSEINGWVTVANIKAYQGTDLTTSGGSGLGNFGAWTLVLVYEDNSESLKNISIFDGYQMVANETGFTSVDITVDGFLTPTYGDIYSTISIFAGEGDKNIEGDKLYVDNSVINSTNAFYSSTSGFDKNPSYTNNQGIDIQNHDIGSTGLNIIQNGQTSSTITLTSSQDKYFPNMVAFTTELYQPRVCYKQEFLDASGNPITTLNVGDTITVHTWIANMKKDVLDLNLEDALKVEITMELDTDNLDYTPNTMNMKNIGATVYTATTDGSGDDLGEFSSLNDTFTWRVGTGATSVDGGTLTPNGDGNASNKAYITFQTTLLNSGEINVNNLYKVSYEDSLSGVRFGDESPIDIGLCTDINTSLGVAGALGKFNVVNAGFTSATDYTDPAQNALVTQVANRAFDVKVISLEDDGSALKNYTGNVKVSLIATPDYAGCNADAACKQTLCENAASASTAIPLTFSGSSSKTLSGYTIPTASKSLSFRVSYDSDSKFSCSVDSFAVRPDSFVLSQPAGTNINLLKSANNYNFSLNAISSGGSSGTPGYSVTNAQSALTILKQIYQSPSAPTTVDSTLSGTLAFSGFAFNITNGQTSNAGINFDDVGRVNIEIQDRTWAKIDIDNGDTAANCSATGAYICGNIDATFIPDNFNFATAAINNENGGTFTYLSNNTNMRARMAVTLQARNANNAITQNFNAGNWENPVDITMTVTPAFTTPSVNIDNADETILLGFANGTITIPWNETNTQKQLSFNFPRAKNTALNPFVINGADVNLTASSIYTNGGTSVNIQNSKTASQSATFLYERVHAPRYRFAGSSGTAFIYYESYCNGTDTNGNTCNTALLPDGATSQITDDPRWFVNTQHVSALGTINSVTQKGGGATVTETANVQATPYSSTLTYNGSSFPYKTTMQITPSNWLIYNRYDPAASNNDFDVEFESGLGVWNGVNEAESNTNNSGATKTNRRSMW